MNFNDRFDAKWEADEESGCWVWTAATRAGYGRVWDGDRVAQAHRLSYERANGSIPDGMQIDHLCRVRNCVNPDHLEAVTQKENIRRGEALTTVWARMNKCKYGHDLIGDNVRTSPSTGARTCRICNTARNKAGNERRRSRNGR